MKMSAVARSGVASIAAEPVSPEVAPMMVTRLAALRQHLVEQPADQLQREILESQGRAVEQLEQPQPRGEFPERRHAGSSKPA